MTIDHPHPATEAAIRRALPGTTEIEEVGSGGFAVVYRALQPAMRRTVAVKVLTTTIERAEDRERFETEVRAMGAVSDHPAIVTLLAAGLLDDGRPYLQMDFMEGGTLAACIARGPLGPREAAAVAARLADALASAHATGVLHCDVKPRNVLASRHGDWRLADFGVACLGGAGDLPGERVVATPAYAPPETLRGAPASPATDVYGLAATLHEMLIGVPPPQVAVDALDGVPEPLAAVVRRGLAEHPQDRFPSARALAAALGDASGVPEGALDPMATRFVPLRPPAEEPPARRPRRLARAGALVATGLAIATSAALGFAFGPNVIDGGQPPDTAAVAVQPEPVAAPPPPAPAPPTAAPDAPAPAPGPAALDGPAGPPGDGGPGQGRGRGGPRGLR